VQLRSSYKDVGFAYFIIMRRFCDIDPELQYKYFDSGLAAAVFSFVTTPFHFETFLNKFDYFIITVWIISMKIYFAIPLCAVTQDHNECCQIMDDIQTNALRELMSQM